VLRSFYTTILSLHFSNRFHFFSLFACVTFVVFFQALFPLCTIFDVYFFVLIKCQSVVLLWLLDTLLRWKKKKKEKTIDFVFCGVCIITFFRCFGSSIFFFCHFCFVLLLKKYNLFSPLTSGLLPCIYITQLLRLSIFVFD
jgi:hypothetical protein